MFFGGLSVSSRLLSPSICCGIRLFFVCDRLLLVVLLVTPCKVQASCSRMCPFLLTSHPISNQGVDCTNVTRNRICYQSAGKKTKLVQVKKCIAKSTLRRGNDCYEIYKESFDEKYFLEQLRHRTPT